MRSFLVGVGCGAALMYLLDPSWGRRRRAGLRARLETGARQVEAWRQQAESRRSVEDNPPELDGRARAEDAEIDWSTGDSYRARLMQEGNG